MDWNFIEEEVLELLDGNGLNMGNVSNLEVLVSRFMNRLMDNYDEESELDENGTDSEWDSP